VEVSRLARERDEGREGVAALDPNLCGPGVSGTGVDPPERTALAIASMVRDMIGPPVVVLPSVC